MPFEPNPQNTLSIEAAFSRRPGAGPVADVLDAPVVQASAARRAAEAAFAAPAPARPASASAQVTVRRRRLPRPSPDAAHPAAPTGSPDTPAAAAARGQRVFRLDAGPAVDAGTAGPDGAAAPPAPLPRSRRVASDKRPGAVVHLVAPPAAAPAGQAPVARPNRLVQALAAVGPLLDAISRAQTFRFDDDAVADEWQRLSRRADAIARDLQTQLRPAGARPARAR